MSHKHSKETVLIIFNPNFIWQLANFVQTGDNRRAMLDRIELGVVRKSRKREDHKYRLKTEKGIKNQLKCTKKLEALLVPKLLPITLRLIYVWWFHSKFFPRFFLSTEGRASNEPVKKYPPVVLTPTLEGPNVQDWLALNLNFYNTFCWQLDWYH